MLINDLYRHYDALPEPQRMLTALGLVAIGIALISFGSLLPGYGGLSPILGVAWLCCLLVSRLRYHWVSVKEITMPLSRRGFLAFAGLALDPERLLWVPGKKLISIPKPVDSAPLCYGDFFNLPREIAAIHGIRIHHDAVYVVVGAVDASVALVRIYGGTSPYNISYSDLPVAIARKCRDEFYARVWWHGLRRRPWI